MRTERRKSGSLRTGKKCCVRSYPKRNAERAATRLIVRGAVFESIVPEAKGMTDEEAAALLRLALTSEPARDFEKTSRGSGKLNNPLETKGALIHPYGRVRSAEGLSPHRELSPRYDMAALPQQGAAPLRRFAAIPAHPQNSTPAVGVCTHFCGFYYPIREVIPIAIYH